MKRTLALLLALLCLISARAETDPPYAESSPMLEARYASRLCDGSFWHADVLPANSALRARYTALYRVTPDGKNTKICDVSRAMSYDIFGGDIYLYTHAAEEQPAQIRQLGQDGKILQVWELPGILLQGNNCEIACTQDYVLIFDKYQKSTWHLYSRSALFALNRNTGECTHVLDCAEECSMTWIGDNKVLLIPIAFGGDVQGVERPLIQLDLSTMERETLAALANVHPNSAPSVALPCAAMTPGGRLRAVYVEDKTGDLVAVELISDELCEIAHIPLTDFPDGECDVWFSHSLFDGVHLYFTVFHNNTKAYERSFRQAFCMTLPE